MYVTIFADLRMAVVAQAQAIDLPAAFHFRLAPELIQGKG